MRKKLDIVETSLLGLGAVATIALIFKERSAEAKPISLSKKVVSPEDAAYFNAYTPRGSRTPQLTKLDANVFSSPKSRIPSMFLRFGESSDDILMGSLNFTPRKMSTPLNEAEYADVAVLADPLTVPPDFERFEGSEDFMIHPNDYALLQREGIIPAGFPIHRTQWTTSLNGDNEFIVGYSEPKTVSVPNGSQFKAVRPEWAVSIGKNFNSSSNPPSEIKGLKDFYDTAMRMLAAEYLLTNTGTNGCIKGINRRLCDMERATLIGIMMQRRRLRDLKRKEIGTFEDIVFANRGQTWNRAAKFLSGFNGYLGSSTKTSKSTRRKFPKSTKVNQRFEDYKNFHMWHVPLLAGKGATHFGHYKSLTHVPAFLKKFNLQHSSDVPGYATQNAVQVGGCAATSHGRTFK